MPTEPSVFFYHHMRVDSEGNKIIPATIEHGDSIEFKYEDYEHLTNNPINFLRFLSACAYQASQIKENEIQAFTLTMNISIMWRDGMRIFVPYCSKIVF